MVEQREHHVEHLVHGLAAQRAQPQPQHVRHGLRPRFFRRRLLLVVWTPRSALALRGVRVTRTERGIFRHGFAL